MTCDLNESHLERFYDGLKTEIGEEAARHFVMMIEDLEDMSATAFLWNFMRLWENKCRWTTQKPQSNDGVTISAHDDAGMWAEAEHCVLNVLSDRRSLDDQKMQSDAIKRPFLRRHHVRPIKENRYFNDGFGWRSSAYDGYHPDYR